MPGSWEILRARENRILLTIIVPPDLGVSLDFAQKIREVQLPLGSDWLRIVNLPYGAARNSAAKEALDKGYHLAFLDADIRVEPDAYMKLLATGLPLVSGLYYQRFPDYMPVLFNEGRDPQGNPIRLPVVGWKPGDIVPATFVPAGLCIYRRHVLEALFQRYKSIFTWGVDIAPLLEPEGTPAAPFSEDFSASWKAKQVGIQPYVATSVVGLHEVRAVIGPKWLMRLPNPDPLFGVVGVM